MLTKAIFRYTDPANGLAESLVIAEANGEYGKSSVVHAANAFFNSHLADRFGVGRQVIGNRTANAVDVLRDFDIIVTTDGITILTLGAGGQDV